MCMDEFNPRVHPAGGGGAPADNRTEHFKVSTQFPFQSFNMTHFLGEIRPIFKHTCFCCSLEAMNYGDCGVWDRAQVTVLHCTPLYHMVSLVTFKKVLQVHLPRSRMLSRKARCISYYYTTFLFIQRAVQTALQERLPGPSTVRITPPTCVRHVRFHFLVEKGYYSSVRNVISGQGQRNF